MDDDIKRPLIRKSGNFDKLYEECQVKLQRIKQKNDFMQKHVGEEAEEEVKQEVRRQKEFLVKEIKQIKGIMMELAANFKDPSSKNKLKAIRTDLQKQIDRNRAILNDLIAKSFIRKSEGEEHQDMEQFVEGGKIDYRNLEDKENNEKWKKDSVLTDEIFQNQQQMQIDYQIERKILNQKNEMIIQVEQTTVRVNQIMNDMANMLNEQGQNLDIVEKNIIDTRSNVVTANQHLEEASKLQKKSRRKYIVFVIIIVFVIAVILGLVFILKS